MADLSHFIGRKGLGQVLTPDQLLQAFHEYVADNAEGGVWQVNRVVKNADKEHELFKVPHRVPLSTVAFCTFAGISHNTFKNYMNPSSSTYQMYNTVAEYITQACATDIFNGSMIGVFNGNLAARMVSGVFGVSDEEATDARKVNEIKHEIVFTEYDAVECEQPLPDDIHMLPAPDGSDYTLPTNGNTVMDEVIGVPRIPVAEVGGYDRMPNTSSRHDNMSQYMERNNIAEED